MVLFWHACTFSCTLNVPIYTRSASGRSISISQSCFLLIIPAQLCHLFCIFNIRLSEFILWLGFTIREIVLDRDLYQFTTSNVTFKGSINCCVCHKIKAPSTAHKVMTFSVNILISYDNARKFKKW